MKHSLSAHHISLLIFRFPKEIYFVVNNNNDRFFNIVLLLLCESHPQFNYELMLKNLLVYFFTVFIFIPYASYTFIYTNIYTKQTNQPKQSEKPKHSKIAITNPNNITVKTKIRNLFHTHTCKQTNKPYNLYR